METGFNLLGTLKATTPAFSQRLANIAARRRVAVAAAQLPACLTGCFYLECRLLGPNDHLDLIVRVDAAGRSVIARGLARGDAAWERLARFASVWGEDGSAWRPALEALWLEFDLPASSGPGGEPLPIPRIFFDFTRIEIQRQRAARAWADAVTTAAVLVGAPPPREIVERLERCLAALPAGASLPYLGLRRVDAWDDIRLCVAGLTSVDLPLILHALEWRGDIEAVERRHAQLVHRLGATNDRIDLLHLDLAPPHVAGTGRVGLEVATSRFERGALLDAIVDEGLCDPARRVDLDLWPARFVSMLPHQIWRSRTTRKVNHVKIVHDQDGAIETKAYLALSHTFHQRRPADRLVAPPLHQ